MKKFCCFLLVFAMLLPMTTTVFAADTDVTDTTSYIEPETGDTIRLETVGVSTAAMSRKGFSTDVYTMRIFRNTVLEETMYIDFAKNILRHEYPNGTVITQALSDVVTISKVEPSIDNESFETLLTTSNGTTRTDYIGNEPFTILKSGVQATLAGATMYSGYQAMGYSDGYYYAPDVFGYLQRKNAGVVGTYHSNRFVFTAGTTIGTAAGIIVAFYTNNKVGGIILSLVVTLLSPIIDLISYDWSTVFEVKSYEWQYRTRLNSNTGTIIDTNYRIKDFWKSYNPATGAVSYEHRPGYDSGFALSNYEMIKKGIDEYLEG